MIELISIGDHLKAGEYKLHSRFKKAVNFRCDDSLIAVVDESVGAGPLNVVITSVGLNKVISLEVSEGYLYLNGDVVPLLNDFRYNSRIELKRNINYDKFLTKVIDLRDFLNVNSPAGSLSFLIESELLLSCEGIVARQAGNTLTTTFDELLRERMRLAVNLIESGNFYNGIKVMKGLGYGLTPSGDDFIAGIISGLTLAGILLGRNNRELINSIYDFARGLSFISNAFLYCAKEGWYTSKQKALIQALFYGEGLEFINSAEALLTIGETSGADWGIGLVITLMKVHEIS